jgi:hypothetical protein
MAVIFPILSTFDAAGVNKAQRAFKGLSGVTKAATLAFGAITIAATKFGVDAAKAAAADEKSMRILEQQLQNTLGANKAMTASVEDYISKTQMRVGVQDDLLRPSFGRLIRSTEDASKAQELLNIALDIQVATGKPLEAIVNALGKGYDGNATALSRLGLGLDQSVLKSKDFTKVTDVLKKSFGGFADNEASSLEGKFRIFNIALDETKESLGKALLPALTNVMDYIIQNILPALEVFINALTGNQSLSSSFSASEKAAYTWGNVIRAVVQTIVNYIPYIAAFGAVLVATFAISKIAAAAGAIIKIIQGIIFVYEGLILVASGASIATAFATGGTSAIAGAAGAAAAVAAIGVAFVAVNAAVNKYKQNTKDVPKIEIAPDGIMDDANKFKDVVLPAVDGVGKTADKTSKAVSKTSKAIKGLSEAGKLAKAQMAAFGAQLEIETKNLEALVEQFDEFKQSVKDAINGVLNFGSAQEQSAASIKAAEDAQAALTKAQEDYDKSLKTNNIEAQQTALENLQAAQTEATNSITKKKSFLQVLQEQADLAGAFAGKVQTLISMGLAPAAITQVLSAGADAGSKIADEIIAGGSTVVNKVNELTASTTALAELVATESASAFYQAGITSGQAIIDGIKAAMAAAGFTITADGQIKNTGAMKKVADKLKEFRGKKSESGTKLSGKERQTITDLANSLGVDIPKMAAGGIVTQPTLALIGEAGAEAVVPLTGRNAGMGNTINVTVNAGMGADGTQIGREIVDAIKRYERVSGPVFASA